jgi:hypothetical protein
MRRDAERQAERQAEKYKKHALYKHVACSTAIASVTIKGPSLFSVGGGGKEEA